MDELVKMINELEKMIRESKSLPFSSGKVVVETDVIMEHLDRMRVALPNEMGQAKELLGQRDDIVNSAVKEAERYMEDSKKQAEKILNEQEIVVSARQKAEEMLQSAHEQAQAIINDASKEADTLRLDADHYAYHLMEHMELVLKKGIDTVRQGKEELGVESMEQNIPVHEDEMASYGR